MVHDFCVIGGGIVGLATAWHLVRERPGASVVVLEKEGELARHQTGHNSGVIHSGIYYRPGSLKARLCVEGAALVREFSREHDIPVIDCGKLIVATSEAEVGRLNALVDRAGVNGVGVRPMSAAELREFEPNVRGLAAAFVPSTGVIDYRAVARALAADVARAGGSIAVGAEVDRIDQRPDAVHVAAGGQAWSARRLVVCGGLQADRLARLDGLPADFRVVPFRGIYYRLPAARADLVTRLIYPVPDPDLPFLGVHVTRTADGGITLGPNAVLGLAREGYEPRSASRPDVLDYLRWPGFWRFARRNAATGAAELRNTLSKRAYLATCRRYCPSLGLDDLLPMPAGIRAQVLLRDGSMAEDFLYRQSGRSLHVINAPSPAATASLPIGAMIARRCLGLPDRADAN
jgi:(S)-2-hydroxyglutarate dehydrogenase